ncbi:hypothetical protein J6590_042491 [Homalodisca vitripennis]|nr:hypothetical protein J6590_042491 [Homalodisca vitripennis]
MCLSMFCTETGSCINPNTPTKPHHPTPPHPTPTNTHNPLKLVLALINAAANDTARSNGLALLYPHSLARSSCSS